ncbi:MAG: hypothetical protein ACTSWX_16695 [Promethearchaeota archaeon]
MKITEKAMEYLKNEGLSNLGIFEITIPTCCSTVTLPRVIGLDERDIPNDNNIFQKKEFEGMVVYLEIKAAKYWDEGSIDLAIFADSKSLILKHPSIKL